MNSLRYGSPRTEDILNSLAQDRLHHTLSLPSSAIAIAIALPSFRILNKRRRRKSSAQSERPSITGRAEGRDVAVNNLPDDALPSHGRAEGSNAMMDGNGAESLSLSLWLLFIDGPTSQNWKKT